MKLVNCRDSDFVVLFVRLICLLFGDLLIHRQSQTKAQELNKAAIQFNYPDTYLWSQAKNYNPYVPLTQRQIMLSEYGFFTTDKKKIEIYLIFYDPKIKNETEQAWRKEYYWKYINATGVTPTLWIFNTTFSIHFRFQSKLNDFIAFHHALPFGHITNYQISMYDILLELAPGSGYLKRTISSMHYTSFPLMSWRFSEDPVVSWDEIVQTGLSLRPPYPSPVNESVKLYHQVSPQDLQILENPCATDLFVSYLIVQQRQDHSKALQPGTGPRRKVYFTIPLISEDPKGRDWQDITQAFCFEPTDCALVDRIILTNAYLLAISNRGVFVSESLLKDSSLEVEDTNLPILPFHLIDPCSTVRDLFYCYNALGLNPLIHSITIHYMPVCVTNQKPNFRDIVILIISHDVLGDNLYIRNQLGWTVLYAEQPYVDWHLLVKGATNFDKHFIHKLKSVYYNHQLNHFDFVAQVGSEIFPVESPLSSDRRFIRFILPMNNPQQKPNYYTALSTELGKGFLPKFFPLSFEFVKIEVTMSSFDIHFLGNQIWIAESGGYFVYLSVANVAKDIEYCNFNHPDRLFVCVDVTHTQVLIGKVSAYYRAFRIHIDDLPDIQKIGAEEGWYIKPSSGVDNSNKRFIEPNYKSEEGLIIEYLCKPIVRKAFKGIFYRVSRQGSLQIWYMEGGMKYEKDLIPLEAKVDKFEDALKITSTRQPRFDASTSQDSKIQFENDVKQKAETAISSFINDFRSLFESRLLLKSQFPSRLAVINIRPTSKYPFFEQENRPALCPFLIDSITVALYEASLVKTSNLGLTKSDVGSSIICVTSISGARKETCNLYIRHIKFIDSSWLPGFTSVAYAYVLKSIPMHAFVCPTRVHVNPGTNDAFIYVSNSSDIIVEGHKVCAEWTRERTYYFIGWTFYIPGHFSVLINQPIPLQTLPDNSPPNQKAFGHNQQNTLFGKATASYENRLELELGRYEGMLINMASSVFIHDQFEFTKNQITQEEEQQYLSLPAYFTRPSICLYELMLLPNPLLKDSGGVIDLDLHESVSFSVNLKAAVPQGEVMMQQVLLKITNSNPKILLLKRNFKKRLASQSYDILVKPTGFGMGQSTVVVRSLSCLPSCLTPCSLSFVFQLMRRDGRRLKIHYPIKIPTQEILSGSANDGKIYRNSTAVYMTLPPNYRPPSVHGIDIPTTRNIYNADPSKPLYRSWYEMSKVTGIYKRCKDKKSREDCGCKPVDIMQEHPEFTDCKVMVYLVGRTTPITFRITYAPVMKAAFQHQNFFLEKPHLVVWVTEINGREDYTLQTNHSSYLDNINNDKELNRGRRFYDATGLTFVFYGTGLYHFRASLGEFDSFDDVSGYFTIYSEDNGLNDFTFLLIFFGTMVLCLILLLFGFIRAKNRLLTSIIRKEIVEEVKLKSD